MLALLCFAACALAASPEEAPVETSERPVHLNHLIQETSPYLLQHAHNPVEWYPWGEEALAKAKAEDKPIFLSIGYSACHWCHVMAHESFESEGIAAIMNEHFVNVKVDREERPDLDEIYMAATVAMSGSGGWPMSVWLTPDLKPFYCGTYFPPEDRFGRPGFPRVLEGIAIAWNTRREDVLKNAEGLTAHITQQMTATGPAPQAPTAALMENAYAQLTRTFDAEEGGWGNAPKFPNSGAILLLLRAYHRNGDAKLLHMATHTLDKMARGGMYDQLGGGFHRYSVDGEWLVPHFEKMLYDNAQLAVAYLEAYQATGNVFYRQVVIETLDYLLRDLRDAGGGFHSAEDADSEGEEGKFYVWTALEIESVLGADAAAVFNHYYAIQYKGNFESHEPYHAGQNIPHVTGDVAATAATLGSTPEAVVESLAASRAALFAHRAKRVRPHLDDKVLTSWNALAISAFAQAGAVLAERRFRDAAVEAGRFLLQHMERDGLILRAHREGHSRLPGYLDDYAFTANAFVDLYEATGDAAWIRHARRLADGMMQRFWDEAGGTFFFTGEDHTNLIVRTKPTYDGAEPSGNSIAAMALLRLGALTDNAVYRARAQRVVEAAHAQLDQAPQGFLRMLAAAQWLLAPPVEVAFVGGRGEALDALRKVLYSVYLPNRVVAIADPAAPDFAEAAALSPLLADRTALDGKPTAYVCRNFACDRPTPDPAVLREQLLRATQP